MFRRLPLLAIALTACVDDGDVVGPFTGETRRYVVDSIWFGTTNSQAREFGGDLNGDGMGDNQLGSVISTLASQGNVTTHAADMIGGGVLASSVEIVADDVMNDPTVSVLYLGADGEPGVAVGGTLIDGVYTSNRTSRTRVPGSATVRLPVFADADPSALSMFGVEIDLEADGSGGFIAEIHGAVISADARVVAFEAASQMLAARPSEHIGFLKLFDYSPRDWVMSRDEFVNNSLIASLFSSDVVVSGREALSFGFRAHLSPCPSGRCISAPGNSCFDRLLGGDESDVDCGGSCQSCVAGSTCVEASDCETAVCNEGRCGPASCDNGVRDGFEMGVDCGSLCAARCAAGTRCWSDGDCASGLCGEPPPPCDPDALFGCWDLPSYDTCR